MLLVLLAAAISLSAFVHGSSSSTGYGLPTGPPSALAKQLIPPDMLALYRSDVVKRQCPALPWTVVASIIHQESDDNRHTGGLAGNGANPPAYGASQFQADTWDDSGQLAVNVSQPFGQVANGHGFGVDGDGDGVADIMNPKDSVPATARYLCANGGDNIATLAQAIYAYNHAWWYVYGGQDDSGGSFEGILPLAAKLADGGTVVVLASSGSGPTGQVTITPGANLPGQPITPETMSFLQTVAGIYGRPLIVTTGTNHSYLTVDGLVSDHASGHAADIGMNANGGSDDSPVGDAIATACLMAAGDPPAQAVQEAQSGGLYTRDGVTGVYGRLRVQCIWKTDQGGNHHNHVHIGARPE